MFARHVVAHAEGHAEVAHVEDAAVVAGKLGDLAAEVGRRTEWVGLMAPFTPQTADAVAHFLGEGLVGQKADSVEGYVVGCHLIGRREGRVEFQLRIEATKQGVDAATIGKELREGIDKSRHETTGIGGMDGPMALEVFLQLLLGVGAARHYLGTEDVAPLLVFLGCVVELVSDSTFVYWHRDIYGFVNTDGTDNVNTDDTDNVNTDGTDIVNTDDTDDINQLSMIHIRLPYYKFLAILDVDAFGEPTPYPFLKPTPGPSLKGGEVGRMTI